MESQKNLVRIFKYIIPYKKYIFLSTIGGVIKLTIPLIVPQILKYFTDDLLLASNIMPANEKIKIIFAWLIFLLFLYIVVYIPATYLREFGALYVSNKIMHRIWPPVIDDGEVPLEK